MNVIEKYRYKFFFLLTFLVYFLSFSNNILRVADNNYRFFDRIDEVLIINRLMVSQQESPFAHSAYVGNYSYRAYIGSDNSIIERKAQDAGAMTALTYDDYLESRTPYHPQFEAYMSHPGGTGLLYSLIQEVLPTHNTTNLLLFRLFTILLSALVLSLFVYWLYKNYGLTVALVTFILSAHIPIIILLSYNLWWAFWSYYIPFITATLILEYRKRKNRLLFDNKLLLYILMTCFLKFFFTGFEFITSTLVMAVCPVIYYLILENKRIKSSFIYLTKSSIAALSGILLGVFYLITQARLYTGSWTAGLNHMVDAFFRRSIYNEGMKEPLLLETFKSFGARDVFRLDYNSDITITYTTLTIAVILLCTILYASRHKLQEMNNRANIALIFITLIAASGPLSWIVVFTQHARYHTLDIIVMYMPFCLYAFAIIGLSLKIMIKMIFSRRLK